MAEQLLMSNSNKIRLRDAIQDQTLDEIASAILAASTNQELHHTVLNGAASLPNLTDHFDNEQGCRVVKAITTKVLSSQNRSDSDTHQSPLIAEAGLACLHFLSSRCYHIDEPTLLEMAAYTDDSDPWTTDESAETATKILHLQLSEDKRPNFISNTILQGYLKPLFTRSSTRITESGRPSHYDIPTDRHRPMSQTAAWKQENLKAVAILRWAVMGSSTLFIKNHWPLFTPVMLALVEDDEPNTKSRGLEILAAFVKKCPESVLHGTGIGSVFEEVTFPVLLHLPSTTPEEESIQLLVPAYQVLINLAEAYADPTNSNRRRILDKTLRHGIFTSYHHGSQYVHVVQTLMRYATVIINCLGIYSIKHLQNLLSILSTVMTDPFATAHPPVLLSAAEALNAVISNCWPRILDSEHTEQMIRTISLCWLNLCDHDIGPQLSSEDRDDISEKLLESARMLQSIWKQQKGQPPGKFAEVLDQEPRLKTLFVMSPTEGGGDESS